MRAVVLLLVVCFIALGSAPAEAQRGQAPAGAPSGTAARGLQSPGTTQPQSLTETEAEKLLHMWEEERLALELYEAFFKLWNLPIFENIAASEARHVAAVRTLVDRYGLTPAVEPITGEFPTLQETYDALLEAGESSAQGALETGVAVEEMDIADLGDAMAVTDNKDIDTVYENLLAASLTHLAAFNEHLGIERVVADESQLTVAIVVSPNAIGLASSGEWVTVRADIGYSDVVGRSLALNGVPVAETSADKRGNLVAKFCADDVKVIVEPGTVNLRLSGLTVDGQEFSGMYSVRVVSASAT